MKSYLHLKTMGMGLSFWQNIDYGTVKFDINHNARRQNSKLRELQKWQPNYVYFNPLVNNHCLIKYLKVNILKLFFSEFLFAILPPLSTS